MFWKVSEFVRDFYKDHGPFNRVLDVGARNINGTVKDSMVQSGIPMPAELLGLDMIGGENVDIVMNAHDLRLRFVKDSFDCVTCCETLEHDNKFWVSVEGMRTILKPGGWLLITVPGINFFRHDYPSDYYRFTDSVYPEFFFEGYENIKVENYFDAGDPNKEKPNDSILGYARKPL